MDCASCGHANAEEARFCGDCGEPLSGEVRCPGCDAANPAGQRFCNACGESLEAGRKKVPDRLAEKIRDSADAVEGERKQVTVLFADVIGSMALAESCDPEEWRGIMDRFFAILSDGVHAFEGTVDKFTGDGIMALFGAPIAHEDHAQRACFAALRLIDELAEFSAELRRTKSLNFLVRMGLNSGEVVVGGIGENLDMEYTAVGHTVGLAQRMEQLAEPGKAYLTEHTASLVEGYLALSGLGEFEVKGSSRPLQVYELTGIGAARGRLDISAARGFSRFVGRDDEMAVLESAFEQAKGGEAQIIGVVGEAGVGKSRLCHEFIQRWRTRGVPVYHTTGQAHTRSVPLMPVMHLMRSYFDITDQDSAQKARERIAGKLLLLDETLIEELPLIFDFLAVSDPERPAPNMDAEARHRHLLGVVKRLIRAQSADEPGINVFEDLHWLDPASEVFLANHVDAVQGTRSLTIVNFRPEYRASWTSKPYYGQVALVPLGPEAIAEMIRDQLGSDPSLADLPAILSERTGGNPFFVEEVMRSLVEGGNLEGERGSFRLVRPVEGAVVPASVQVILSARIDRLEPVAKRVLQAASAIGKEFPQPVLASVVELGPGELETALRDLIAAGFLYEQELYPEPVFAFKHPLTQEVAYGSQLGERRAADHAAVARAIEAQHPEQLDERAALLAQHWEAAGEALEAARWNARTASWSGTRDPADSLRHWRKVRELADALPESEESAGLGLTARIFILQYGWRIGIEHEEAAEVFAEAEKMASKAGDLFARAILTTVYGGIRGLSEGNFKAMDELGGQSIALAEESGDPALYLMVTGVCYARFMLGEIESAVRVLDRAIELADGDPTVAAGTTTACPLGYTLIFKGGIIAYPGELEGGRALIEQGMKHCRDMGDVETIGWGHMWLFWNAYFSGETDVAFAHAKEALDVAERIGDAFSRTWAWTLYGAAELLQGHWDAAIEALERGMSMSKERSTAVEGNGWRLTWLAEAHLGKGDAERAVELAREALDLVTGIGPDAAEPAALLGLSRVLLAAPRQAEPEEVEALLARALELAERIRFKTMVPMARVELAELARANGDEEGRERELREAQRLFVEIGATAHAARLEDELPAAAG